jgi:hypothetical protein
MVRLGLGLALCCAAAMVSPLANGARAGRQVPVLAVTYTSGAASVDAVVRVPRAAAGLDVTVSYLDVNGEPDTVDSGPLPVDCRAYSGCRTHVVVPLDAPPGGSPQFAGIATAS